MSKKSDNWGGRRPGAGRSIRQRLAFNRDAATSLHLLTKHQRAALGKPELTEEDIVSQLVEEKWQAIQEAYGPVEEAKPKKSGTIIV